MDPRNLSTAPNDRTSIRTPEGYLRALHPPGSRGKVSLLAKTGTAIFARCFAPDEVAPVLETWLQTTAYVSVNRYAGPRGGRRPISALNCLYADLDVYTRPDLMFLDPGEAEDAIVRRMAALELPEPSMLIDSGRGFYVLWLIDPLPGQAVRRWHAAERCLVELLAPLGADPVCCDAARVLRIPGTINRKADRIVTVVRGDGSRHAFDDLADRIYRAAGRPSRGEIAARRRRRPEDKPSDAGRGLPPAARFGAVLRDLERLRLSWGGEAPEGLRNSWLHLVATALGHVLPADQIEAEAWRQAARGAPGLRDTEVRATVKAAVARAEAVVGLFRGVPGDARLHYSGERMAEILGVDRAMAETLGLEQVVPPDLRHDRNNAARRARRKAGGGRSRAEYLAVSGASRERPWDALGIKRATYYARGLHRKAGEPSKAAASSASDAGWTGPVSQQGAHRAAGGPERSSRNRENPALRQTPPSGQPNPENEPTRVAGRPSRGCDLTAVPARRSRDDAGGDPPA
jgi:hypothetical protein